MDAAATFLRANSDAYEHLVSRLMRVDPAQRPDAALHGVARAATFAGRFHPGRFADGNLENVVLKIGAGLAAGPQPVEAAEPPAASTGRRRVLHVATVVVGIGGHTRMLQRWITKDKASCHSVFVTSQGAHAVPVWLADAIRSSGGELVICPEDGSSRDKAVSLRRQARQRADLVVLHHGGNDVVPTLAFATAGGPPVALLDHADHMFWLGSSVADIVINLRSPGSANSLARRFSPAATVLPIPLTQAGSPRQRDEARRELGIPADQLVLLSVGRAIKFRPCGAFDFIATATKTLNRHPSAHLYVVGETAAGMAPFLAQAPHPRIHFLGELPDPSAIRAAADLYIESFPFGSNTALLEAALDGLAVVPAYRSLTELLVAANDSLADLLASPPDEEAHRARIDQLIANPAERREFGAALRRRLLEHHVEQGWLDHLARVYAECAALAHRPRPIPATFGEATPTDLSLGLWSLMANDKAGGSGPSPQSTAATLLHAAFVSKDIGRFGAAVGLSLRAVAADWRRGAAWRLLAASMFAPFKQVALRLPRRQRA